jgi:hypothetical protein
LLHVLSIPIIAKGGAQMTLTEQQKHAVEQGQAVPVSMDGTPCIVLLEEVYNRVKRILAAESDPQGLYPAVLSAWDAVGSPHDADDYRT